MAGNLGFYSLQAETEKVNRELVAGHLLDERQQAEFLSSIDMAVNDAHQILAINHAEDTQLVTNIEWSDLVQEDHNSFNSR